MLPCPNSSEGGCSNGPTTSKATSEDGSSYQMDSSPTTGKHGGQLASLAAPMAAQFVPWGAYSCMKLGSMAVCSLRCVYSLCRTQEEMAHTCRGTINLAGAFIDTIDSTNFVITNGPSQVYHLRALNEVERQRWVTTLELAKSKAIKNLESGEHSACS